MTGSFLYILKMDADKARKIGNKQKAISLITLYSEAKMIGKNDGNRETTDDEVLGIIQKFIKNINELLSHPCNSEFKEIALKEKTLYESYLPDQLNEEELKLIIQNEYDAWPLPLKIGIIMKFLKEQYPNQYDSKLASKIAKEIIK